MNIGGRERLNGLEITMVQALHSSSAADHNEDGHPIYLGVATGFIVRLESGTTIYFAGDTGLFGDMKIFRERYAPAHAPGELARRQVPDEAHLACRAERSC